MADLILAKKSDLQSVADKIKSETGLSSSLSFPSGFTGGIENVRQKAEAKMIEKKYATYTLSGNSFFSGVTGDYAFAGNTYLTTISVMNGFNASRGCFYNCTNLQTVNFIGNVERGIFTSTDAFRDCYSLQSIKLASTSGIGDYAFNNCYALNSVTFSDENPYSFYTIGSHAFDNCRALTSFVFDNAWSWGVRYIYDYAFYQSGLQTVNIKGYNLEVGKNAFAGCTSLTSVTLTNVITIDDYAFYGCTALESITIPSTCKRIGKNAFAGCTNLKTINFASRQTGSGSSGYNNYYELTQIDSYAFRNTGLTSISIPWSCQTIGASAFASCADLSTVTIDYTSRTGSNVTATCNLTTINPTAFRYCTSLTSFTIPESVTSVGNYCFGENTSMQYVRFLSTTPPTIGSRIFTGLTGNSIPKIYVPGTDDGATCTTYKATSNLTTYSSQIYGWDSIPAGGE